jgi:polyisoprenoid-binding protein YceI
MRLKSIAGIAIFAFTLLTLTACENPATGKTEAEVSDVDPNTMVEQVSGQELIISSDESAITWVGSKVTGSHDGGFKVFEGTITLGEGGPTESRVKVLIDATSIWADNDKLTGHLQSADFFDVETHPQARFTSTAIAETAEGFEITGELELHGVTKQVKFPATIEVEGDRVTAQAEFFIQRFDFDIAFPGKADDLIRDEVVIKFDLVAVPAG